MSIINKFSWLLAAGLLLPAACFGDQAHEIARGMHRDKMLQRSFEDFPVLNAYEEGQDEPEFEEFELTDPVKVGSMYYYGFRFTVPQRGAQEDFVWTFVCPPKMTAWYILPKTGQMDGFEEYFYKPRKYYAGTKDLLPKSGKTIIVQYLSGKSLQDGADYLVWFSFKSENPGRISLKFMFTNVPEEKTRNRVYLEKAVGLQHK